MFEIEIFGTCFFWKLKWGSRGLWLRPCELLCFFWWYVLWHHGVVVITTAQLHSTKPELRFCAGSNPARAGLEIRDGEDLWKWSRLEKRLNTFRRSTIPQKNNSIQHSDDKYLIYNCSTTLRCGSFFEKKHRKKSTCPALVTIIIIFFHSNIPVFNLVLSSRNMIKAPKSMSL